MKYLLILFATFVFSQIANGRTMHADPVKTLIFMNGLIRSSAGMIATLEADLQNPISVERCTNPNQKLIAWCRAEEHRIKIKILDEIREIQKMLHEHCANLKDKVEQFKVIYSEEVILGMPDLINPAACATTPTN